LSTLTKIFIVVMVVLAILASVLFINQATTTYNWKTYAESLKDENAAYKAQTARQVLINEAQKAAVGEAESSNAAQLAAIQLQLDQQAKDSKDKQQRIASLEVTNANLEASNVGLAATVQQLTAQYGQLRKAWDDREKAFEAMNQQSQRADRDMKELARDLEHAKDASQTFQEQLVARDERIKDLEKAVMEGGGKAAVSMESIPRQAAKIEGTVTAVIPDQHLAQLNVGSASGVTAGMKFILYRGADLVGWLTINQVDPSSSAGTLTYEKLAPKQGDKATTTLK
jgi:predicted  nucleic acid-binding Zn-ribbon protein